MLTDFIRYNEICGVCGMKVSTGAILIVLICILISSACKTFAAIETIKDKPYFKVRYERVHVPAEISSKQSAAKNLAIYKNHIAANKRMMAQADRNLRTKLAQDLQKRKIAQGMLKDDRRESMRFICSARKGLGITINNKPIQNIIDISNGGIGFRMNNVKKDNEFPVKISYAGTSVEAKLKIVADNNGRLGGKFTGLNEENESKLVYITSLLETENKTAITRFLR